MAVDVLRSRGVPEDHILFLNLIASPEGVQNFADKFPKVRVVTAFVDEGLNEKKYVIPFFTRCSCFRPADLSATATSFPGWAISATGSSPSSILATTTLIMSPLVQHLSYTVYSLSNLNIGRHYQLLSRKVFYTSLPSSLEASLHASF